MQCPVQICLLQSFVHHRGKQQRKLGKGRKKRKSKTRGKAKMKKKSLLNYVPYELRVLRAKLPLRLCALRTCVPYLWTLHTLIMRLPRFIYVL